MTRSTPRASRRWAPASLTPWVAPWRCPFRCPPRASGAHAHNSQARCSRPGIGFSRRWGPRVPGRELELTNKAVRLLDIAATSVMRNLRKGTERARALRPWRALICPGLDSIGRNTVFDPLNQRIQDIELVGRLATETMIHSRYREQPHEPRRLTAIDPIDFIPPVDRVVD